MDLDRKTPTPPPLRPSRKKCLTLQLFDFDTVQHIPFFFPACSAYQVLNKTLQVSVTDSHVLSKCHWFVRTLSLLPAQENLLHTYIHVVSKHSNFTWGGGGGGGIVVWDSFFSEPVL